MARGQEEQGHRYTTISPGFTAFSDPYACMQSASPNEPSLQSLQQYTLTKKMLRPKYPVQVLIGCAQPVPPGLLCSARRSCTQEWCLLHSTCDTP